MRCSFDPLLCRWLQYQAIVFKSDSRPETEQAVIEESFSDKGARKKIFRTLHESVHSLSDKEKKKSDTRTEWSKGVSGAEDLQKSLPVTEDTRSGVCEY